MVPQEGAAAPKPKAFDPYALFTATAEERAAMAERATMRQALRKEWRKKITNPYKGVNGYVFDPLVQRFISMRAPNYALFKPTTRNAFFAITTVVLPIVLSAWYGKSKQLEFDDKCRKGEIAYKDRKWKLI